MKEALIAVAIFAALFVFTVIAGFIRAYYWREYMRRRRHDARYTDAEHNGHSCETQMQQDAESR